MPDISFTGQSAEIFSRKRTIMIACIVFILGAALQTGTNGYAMMVVGRAIAGIGIGLLSMVVPLYISELGKSLHFHVCLLLLLY